MLLQNSSSGPAFGEYLTTVPATRLLAQDVLDVYRGRGGFENDFAAEDHENAPDRWCSHTP